MSTKIRRDVIIACDFAGAAETLHFLDKFDKERPFVKIGMELYYAEGPDIVRRLKDRGHQVFLDLKLHDIPNTVKKAMRVLRDLGADLINLHAGGGKAMMEAAIEGLTRPDGSRPRLIAVTQLTSTSQDALEHELLIRQPLEEVVLSYALTAKEAGLDGVVCSPLEASGVHARCGSDFLTVTPGIRYPGSAGDDQHRVTTPEKAGQIGCDLIVVGRPITQSPNPLTAWMRCVDEFIND